MVWLSDQNYGGFYAIPHGSAASCPSGRTTACLSLCFTSLTLLLFSASALAQSTAGRILGTLTDQSGAAVAGATVVVTDVQRGTSRTLTTDESGAYAAPDLQPGTYKIHVEAKGFKSLERPNVLIEVATDVRADFALQPGQVTETVVTITEDVPLVNTTSATLGGTLSNKEINDLPLNGRNYENLLQLRPGVMRYPGGGFSTTSTNGLRAEDNAYFIEGLFNSEPFSGQGIINGAGIAGDSATILPIDAIQEFNVQENPPAEYGWKPGAVMNVGLKSGTNSLHGTAFAFGRDGAMDARNYFNADSRRLRLPELSNSLAAAWAAPSSKTRPSSSAPTKASVMTSATRYSVTTPFDGVRLPAAGNCTSPLVDGRLRQQHSRRDCRSCSPMAFPSAPPASRSPAARSPEPPSPAMAPASPSTTRRASTSCTDFPTTWASTTLLAKVDYNLNQRNSISGMYFFGNNNGTVEDFPELQSELALQDPHPRSSRRRKLDLDSRHSLGQRSPRRLQPPLPAHVSRRP